MTFRGWSPEAFDFYAELETNNNRGWWQEHRSTYRSEVVTPFEEFAAIVEAEFGTMRIFRPNRDVRFSRDKTPYKTAAAAMTESEGGSSYYLQLSAEGLMAGVGMYHLAPDQLTRYRAAVADDRTGSEVAAIADEIVSAGYEVASAESLKTAPRGWDREHPRIGLARRKGLVMTRSFPRAKWQSTPAAAERILSVWRDAAPLAAWLDLHVGPSTLPPPEPRGAR